MEATLKYSKNIPGIFLKNLEISWKYHGILSVRKCGNPVDQKTEETENRAEKHTKKDKASKASKYKKGNNVVESEQVEVQTVEQIEQSHVPLVKSPSDTTIYTPALRKLNNDDISLIEKISNFVESIRLDTTKRRDSAAGKGTTPSNNGERGDVRRVERVSNGKPRSRSPQHHCSAMTTPPQQSGKNVRQDSNESPNKVTEQLLLQAETFKARIEAPKGNYGNYNELLMPYDYDKLKSKFVTQEGLAPLDSEIMFLSNFDQDDEFFHVTSQIEPSLRLKIEK